MNKPSTTHKFESALKFTVLAGILLLMSGCMEKYKAKVMPNPKKTRATKAEPRELKQGVLQTESGEASFDEMVAQVEFDVQKGHYLAAAQWLDKLIRRYPEHPSIPEFKYKRAECCFLGKKYLLASEAYDGFAKLYPSDPREKDARFLALSSLYNHTKSFSVDCDSTDTRDVIGRCNEMLQDESMAEKHKQVAAIMKHCQDRLLNKEVAVFDSYVRRKKIDSAAKRLEKIKTEHLAHNQQIEPRVVYLECKLASVAQDENKAKECLELLEEKYPDSKYTRMASGYANSGTLANAIFG
jgi:outer membrane assembly lipoprotein YfiO